LVTYYNFDNSSAVTDDGPNNLLNNPQNVNFISSGQISGAVSFNGNTSSFEIYDFTAFGVVNQPFSISLWIRPYALAGTILFVQNGTAGNTWCIPFIGFSSNGSLVAQMWTGTTRSILGPTLLTLSIWHHVVQTWSSTNGLRLYVDNVLVATNTTVTTFSASGLSDNIKLANRPSGGCTTGALGPQLALHGDMDEFRIYSRELAADDVCALYLYF
jgi:Concanavalin A-like lectin/glucanases superfamily